jgi:hypothetical protein
MIFLDEISYSQRASCIFIEIVFITFKEYEVWGVLDHVRFFEHFVAHHINHCKVSDVFEFKSNFIEVSLEILADAAFLIVEEYKPRFISYHFFGTRIDNKHIVIRVIYPFRLVFNVNFLAIIPVFAILRVRLTAYSKAYEERKQ